MPGRTLILIALLILLCVTCSCYERVRRDGRAYAVQTRIDAGQGRSITILTIDEFLEESAWYYEINADGKVAVPMTFLYNCCYDSRAGFTTLYTSDRNIVGLVWDRRPDVLLMLHDFTTGENCPRHREQIWCGRLRDRLKADNPGLRLELNE